MVPRDRHQELFFPQPSRRYRRTCPVDHRSALIGLYFSDLGRHPTLRPAFVIDLIVLVLYLHSDIEVDNFQAKVSVERKVVLMSL